MNTDYKTAYNSSKEEYNTLLQQCGKINIQQKYTNSVFQIFVSYKNLNKLQPFSSNSDKSASGSGFLLYLNEDERKSLIITNAHVVATSKNVWAQLPKTGDEIIKMKILYVSLDKDIALLEIDDESFDLLINITPKSICFKLHDSLLTKSTDKVIAIGYPLGNENIQFTSGDIGGYSNDDDTNFLQITAPINPGNSGGPLITEHGDVVGINSAGIIMASNIGYAIPSRTLRSILEMVGIKIEDNYVKSIQKTELTSKILNSINLGLKYNKTSDDMFSSYNLKKPARGILITFINDWSFLKQCTDLKVGDIITEFVDIIAN